MEFVHLDELVFVEIDGVKHVFQGASLLSEYFQEMIKYIVLCDHSLLLLLQCFDSFLVIFSVKVVELFILYNAVFISVDFAEKCCDFGLLESEVEVLAEACVEVLQCQEADTGVEAAECLTYRFGTCYTLLDRFEHFQTFELLLEASGDSASICGGAKSFR